MNLSTLLLSLCAVVPPAIATTGEVEYVGGATTYDSPSGGTLSGAVSTAVRVAGSATRHVDGTIDVTVRVRGLPHGAVTSVFAFEGAAPANTFAMAETSYEASTSTVTWTGSYCGPGSMSCPIGDLLDSDDLWFSAVTVADGTFVGELRVPMSSHLAPPSGGGGVLLFDADARFDIEAGGAVAYEMAVSPIPVTGGASPKVEIFEGPPSQGGLLIDRLSPNPAAPPGSLAWLGTIQQPGTTAIASLNRNAWWVRLTSGSGVTTDWPVHKGILNRDRSWISAQFGGHQGLVLDAGAQYADNFYLILSSATGKGPQLLPGLSGSPLGLPLTADALFLSTLASPGAGPVLDSFGSLDAKGRGFTSFFLPGGVLQLSNPIEVHHAAVVITPFGSIEEFSGAVSCQIRPGV